MSGNSYLLSTYLFVGISSKLQPIEDQYKNVKQERPSEVKPEQKEQVLLH